MPRATHFRNLCYHHTDLADLLLDLDLPPVGDPPFPLVIWLYGGGWMAGSKEDRPVIRVVDDHLLGQGYAIASVNYRPSGVAPFPAQLADVQAAVQWLRANAVTYQLDPQRIGIWGFSSGGHLAALLGTQARPEGLPSAGEASRVQAVCTFAAPTDLQQQLAELTHPQMASLARTATAQLLGTPTTDDAARLRWASPVYYVTPTSAPFFLLNGDRDPLVPVTQMTTMAAALEKAGVPVTTYLVRGGDHGMAGLPKTEVQTIVERIAAFFATYL
ncbi:MAG TPA: alpha/beta hydrolase [Chloroflexia bacterium]|nr:alpha/beta hydrolase [Chloroflexia bacterium]